MKRRSLLEDRGLVLGRSHMGEPVKKGAALWILIGIVAVGVLLRLYRIDVQCFSHDEIGRIACSRMEMGDTFDLLVADGHAPAYPILLKGWMQVLSTEMTSRHFALLLGILFIPAVYGLAVKLVDRRVALVAAALGALSPFHVEFSQQGSLYTMVMLLSVLGVLSFMEILSGGGRRWWVAYFLSVTVGLYTHVFMAALPILATLFLLLRWRSHGRRLAKGWIVCHVLMTIVYLPWVLVMLRLRGKVTGFQKAVGPLSVLYTFFTYSLGFTIGPSVAELQRNTSIQMVLPYLPMVLVSASVFGVLSLAGILGLWKSKDSLLLLLLYLLVPIVLVYGISSVTNVTYNVRYACASFPAYLVLLAVGLARMRTPAGMVLGTAVLCLFALSLRNHYFDSRYSTEDLRSAGAYIEREATADDVVFVVSLALPFLYYYDDEVAPVEGLNYMDMRSEENVVSKIQRTVRGRNRMWLVLARPWYRDPYGAAKRYLDEHYQLVKEKKFPGTEVYGYQLD